jgi:class 3 adenylate cyclase
LSLVGDVRVGHEYVSNVDSADICPLPEHPLLREAASALGGAGHFVWMVDRDWRVVYMNEEARIVWASRNGKYAAVALGHHLFSSDSMALRDEWRYGLTTVDLWRNFFRQVGGMVLHDTAGGRDALREIVDPHLVELIDDIEPSDATFCGFEMLASGLGTVAGSALVVQRLLDTDGEVVGTVLVGKPMAGLSVLTGLAWYRDPAHLDRMEQFEKAGRHPAAILFADLEGSSALSRTMSTAGYFALGRRLVRAADQSVVDAGGLVGRHVGDGVVAFFPATTSGSESAASRACIEAAKSLRSAVSGVAERSGLGDDDVTLRFGLHWGSTLYIGRITTSARTEVTALGDQVNEAARIEACATGGRTLASKDLVERLDAADAATLGLDLDHTTYTQLADLTTATDKARRDAPAIAVCEL